MSDSADDTTRVVILASQPTQLNGTVQFLRKRDWQVELTGDLQSIISHVTQIKAQWLVVSANYPNPKLGQILQILRKTLNVEIVLFAERMDSQTVQKLNHSQFSVINGRASGPNFQVNIRRLQKARQDAQNQQSATHESTTNRKQDSGTAVIRGQNAGGPDIIVARGTAHSGGDGYVPGPMATDPGAHFHQESAGADSWGLGPAPAQQNRIPNQMPPSDDAEMRAVLAALNQVKQGKIPEIRPENKPQFPLQAEQASDLNVEHFRQFEPIVPPSGEGYFPPAQNDKKSGGVTRKRKRRLEHRAMGPSTEVKSESGQTINTIEMIPREKLRDTNGHLHPLLQTLSDCVRTALQEVCDAGNQSADIRYASNAIGIVIIRHANLQGCLLISASGATAPRRGIEVFRERLEFYLRRHGEWALRLCVLFDELEHFENWFILKPEFEHILGYENGDISVSFLVMDTQIPVLKRALDPDKFELAIQDLPSEKRLPCDVYLYLPLNNRYIRYQRPRGRLSAIQKQRLIKRKVGSFFINLEDVELIELFFLHLNAFGEDPVIWSV